MAPSTSAVARLIAARARQKAMQRDPMPECGHSPYSMLYTADEALCKDCGLTWAMGRRGWYRVEHYGGA